MKLLFLVSKKGSWIEIQPLIFLLNTLGNIQLPEVYCINDCRKYSG